MSNIPPLEAVVDISVPRCQPTSAPCSRTGGCASFQLTDTRRPLRDFTTGTTGWKAANCPGFLDAHAVRVAPPRPGAKVHDAPKGLL